MRLRLEWIPLFSNKCLSLPHCPKWYFFVFVLQGLLGTVSETLWKRQRRRQNQFYFYETLSTKVTVTNDPCLPPKSPLPPVSRSWQLSACIAMCLSLAVSPMSAAAIPIAFFLCSTVIPMAIWNPSNPAHVKWVKYLGTSQRAEVGGPDSETFGWSCPVGICSDIVFFFFWWKWSKTDVLRGVVPALILSGWHTGYAAPLPHLDSDSSVCLGISRSLMNDLEIKLKQKQPKRFYCLKGFVGGKFKAFSGGALYGSLTNESCWLTVTRSLCLSPYFYLWAYLLFMISCCVTEYFS